MDNIGQDIRNRGASVEVTTAPNTSTNPRGVTLTVKTASGLTKEVVVAQVPRARIPVIVVGTSGYIEKLSI